MVHRLPAVVDTTAVEIRPLAIDGAFEITPVQHGDPRGVFLEWFKATSFREAVGHDLELAQANCSVSAAGVVRGIHFSDVPPGQAKYVTCVAGAVLDVVVDVRVGSPTFGQWDSVLLDDIDRRGDLPRRGPRPRLHVARRGLDRGVPLLDPLRTWPRARRPPVRTPRSASTGRPSAGTAMPLAPVLSEKDAAAPSLAEASQAGLLPHV